MGKGNIKDKEIRINFIAGRLFEDRDLRFTDMWAEYELMYGMSRPTFQDEWKVAKEELRKHTLTVLEAKKEAAIETEREAIKKAILSKHERVIILQNQIEELRAQLKAGTTSDYGTVNGFHIPFEREMNIREFNDTRRTLKEIQAEISKIEGDYAPEKHVIDVIPPILSDEFYEQNGATSLLDNIEEAEIIDGDE